MNAFCFHCAHSPQSIHEHRVAIVHDCWAFVVAEVNGATACGAHLSTCDISEDGLIQGAVNTGICMLISDSKGRSRGNGRSRAGENDPYSPQDGKNAAKGAKKKKKSLHAFLTFANLRHN